MKTNVIGYFIAVVIIGFWIYAAVDVLVFHAPPFEGCGWNDCSLQ